MPCPRCGQDTLALRPQPVQNQRRHPGYDTACTNPNCNWPDPEPGTINLLRYRHGQHADAILQDMREAGTWPPLP